MMSATWLQTTRRLLPRLARLSREIRPGAHLGSAAEVTPELLREQRIEAVLWDVDGTLMSHHAAGLDPSLEHDVGALLESGEFRHAIVSNCQEDRFEELGRIFPDLPVLLGYETAAGDAFHVRHRGEDSWRGPGAPEARATGPLRPLRKPSRRLIEAALDELDVGARREVAIMVGDQYFTDIASANLAGVKSIKVPTVGRATFPAPVRASQRLEAILYRLLYGGPEAGWRGE